MGVRTEAVVTGQELGEPLGDLRVDSIDGLVGTTVDGDELPLVIDEVPVLAALATCARGETWFAGGNELRLKESDRLAGLVSAIVALGGQAAVEGDDLVVVGGGLDGGTVDPLGDHRMAMALTVAALGAEGPSTLHGADQRSMIFSSGARRTSSFRQSALARAISTACAAQASREERVRSSVEAKPQAPSAITRTPSPCDCDSRTCDGCLFLVER